MENLSLIVHVPDALVVTIAVLNMLSYSKPKKSVRGITPTHVQAIKWSTVRNGFIV